MGWLHGCRGQLLQRLQNFVAHTVLHQRRDSSAGAARKELQLSTLASCCKFHLAQRAFRAICGSHPPYLRKLFMECQATHGHKTRHAAKGNSHLSLPKSTFEEKAFSYCSAAIWATLPDEAHFASSISHFNSIVESFLTTSTEFHFCK